MLLVGSSAAHKHYPYIWHTPRDVDWISSWSFFSEWQKKYNFTIIGENKFAGLVDGTIHEVEIAWPGTAAYDLLGKLEAFSEPVVAPMDWLFAFKSSHKYRKNCPHFEKTLRDYHTMKAIGCKIPDKDWLRQREKETYTAKRPSLKTDKDSFFGADQNQYPYDHDSIHKAVAALHKPAYEFYKADDEEVFCSRDKWDACPEHIKLLGVLEESYVLALERSQIPYGDQIDPFSSFKIALMKVCTSITSGWFREYAFENYYKVMELYNDSYVFKFNEGLKRGIVKEAA